MDAVTLTKKSGGTWPARLRWRTGDPRGGDVALQPRIRFRHFRSSLVGEPAPRAIQRQQGPSMLDRECQGRSLLRELQLLRAVLVLPDRFAALRLRGSRAGV